MKIIIVTVYNSNNFGSYLQATQLYNYLSKYGDVCFLNNGIRKNFVVFLAKMKRTIVKKNHFSDIIKGPIFEFIEWLKIRNNWKKYKTIKLNQIDDSYITILGSDEIWNITRKECQFPFLWGDKINTYKISYAPSINKCVKEDFITNQEYIKNLNQIDTISVRDFYSKEVLQEFTNKEIEIVIDPTLLLKPKCIPFKPNYKYIAVYLFEGSLSKKEIDIIRRYAKRNQLKLVSAGQYLTWCDFNVHSIEGNPFYIYENAEYVITNTFHGTLYAINYEKNFVSFSSNKPKVSAMLKQFNLEDRIYSNAYSIETILDKSIDYQKVNNIIDNYRSTSKSFLEKAISKNNHIKESE